MSEGNKDSFIVRYIPHSWATRKLLKRRYDALLATYNELNKEHHSVQEQLIASYGASRVKKSIWFFQGKSEYALTDKEKGQYRTLLKLHSTLTWMEKKLGIEVEIL